MKLAKTTLFLGFCLAILAGAANSAYARTTTGFSAFKVQSPLGSDPYTCLAEDNGAVVNNCSYNVNLVFDLPIDNTGNHGIPVLPYWNGPMNFSCTSYAYAGQSSKSIVGTTIDFLASAPWVSYVNVSNNGMAIQLICWNVPPKAGIATINWSA